MFWFSRDNHLERQNNYIDTCILSLLENDCDSDVNPFPEEYASYLEHNFAFFKRSKRILWYQKQPAPEHPWHYFPLSLHETAQDLYRLHWTCNLFISDISLCLSVVACLFYLMIFVLYFYALRSHLCFLLDRRITNIYMYVYLVTLWLFSGWDRVYLVLAYASRAVRYHFNCFVFNFSITVTWSIGNSCFYVE